MECLNDMHQEMNRLDQYIDHYKTNFEANLTDRQLRLFKRAKRKYHKERLQGQSIFELIDIETITKNRKAWAYWYDWKDAVSKWNALQNRSIFTLIEGDKE